MILAVDAGNSRVKWALHDGRDFVREGWVAHAEIDALDAQWSSLPEPSTVVIANVAGDGIAERLRKSTGRWKVPPRWACSARSQAGVSSRYDDPSQLGIDRWAALIGARRHSRDRVRGGECRYGDDGRCTDCTRGIPRRRHRSGFRSDARFPCRPGGAAICRARQLHDLSAHDPRRHHERSDSGPVWNGRAHARCNAGRGATGARV